MTFNWKISILVGAIAIALPVIGCLTKIETELNNEDLASSGSESSYKNNDPATPEIRKTQENQTLPNVVGSARRYKNHQERLTEVCEALKIKFKDKNYTFQQKGNLCVASPK